MFERVEPSGRTSWKYAVRRADRFPYTWHFHAEHELTLVTAGGGRRFVGDSIENYGVGDLVLVGADLPHTWASDPAVSGRRQEAVVIQFQRDFLGPHLLAAPEFRPVGALLDAAGRGLALPADPVTVRALTGMGALPPAARTLALLDVLHRIAERGGGRVLSAAGFRPQREESARRRCEEVCRYLAENYAEPLTLADAAAVAHLSPEAFSRFFHRNTGRTFTAYLGEIRIQAAKALLTDGELPVAQVASASGFRNLSHFNRRFRTSTGTTPSQFRRNPARTTADRGVPGH